MLEVRELVVRYGGDAALDGVNLRVEAGELVALLGNNGAGKTTLFKAISGLLRVAAGSIEFGGESLAGRAPDALVRKGISHCPEGRKLFPELSVRTNLLLGAYTQRHDRAATAAELERVIALFPDLRERLRMPAGALSGGQQQMVAIGRALMARPRCLLLDEPCLGLAPLVVESTLAAIAEINRAGTMVLLAEQNAHAALHIAQRGYVIENGRIVLAGTAAELRNNPLVIKAYIGA